MINRRLVGELFFVTLFVGILLWFVQLQHSQLHIAERWADTYIASGAASEADREQLLDAFRGDYSWQGADGTLRAYPVSRDSYYFLRLARNIVETGSPCPESPSALACHDSQVSPDIGRAMSSSYSPHVWGIALVYQVLATIDPNPSMLRAGLLHNRLLLLLCALLSYVLIRSIAENAPRSAALVGAATLVFVPAVIQRSYGVDNDVWILALILIGVLATANALKRYMAGSLHLPSILAASVAPLLLFATWGGWPILPMLQSMAVVITVAANYSRRVDWQSQRGKRTQFAIGGALVCCAGIGLFVLYSLLGTGSIDPSMVVSAPPPDAFSAITELIPLTLERLVDGLSWPVILFACIGLVASLNLLHNWDGDRYPATLILVLGWFLGAFILLVVVRYVRYLILIGPPIAILVGVGIATLSNIVAKQNCKPVVSLGLSLLIIATVAFNALTLVRDNRPQLHSAWVSVLDNLSRTTEDDAIVVGWWDAGHWITYWTRRATAVDGASLSNPRIHDVGRVLATNSEEELKTLLAQAACGDSAGCERPIYLVTSSELLQNIGWMFSGFWQSDRAALADQIAANGTVPDGLPDEMLNAAREIDTAFERSLFAAPDAQLWSTEWAPCQVSADNSYDCSLNLSSRNGLFVERLLVPGGRVNEATLIVRGQSNEQAFLLPPSIVRLATDAQLFDVEVDPTTSNPGILLDIVEQRAFLGSPGMLRSLTTRLVLLEGRYDAARFERVSTSATIDGQWVSSWRVLAD